MTEAPEKAGLIRHALGSGLQGLLPGQTHKDAIARWRSTTWHGSKGSGVVTGKASTGAQALHRAAGVESSAHDDA
jgi:hypothetical protein